MLWVVSQGQDRADAVLCDGTVSPYNATILPSVGVTVPRGGVTVSWVVPAL